MESQSGSSKSSLIIFSRIISSSSSSNGRVPVRRQYRIIPSDQTSTSVRESAIYSHRLSEITDLVPGISFLATSQEKHTPSYRKTSP